MGSSPYVASKDSFMSWMVIKNNIVDAIAVPIPVALALAAPVAPAGPTMSEVMMLALLQQSGIFADGLPGVLAPALPAPTPAQSLPVKHHNVTLGRFADHYQLTEVEMARLEKTEFHLGDRISAEPSKDALAEGFKDLSWGCVYEANIQFQTDLKAGVFDSASGFKQHEDGVLRRFHFMTMLAQMKFPCIANERWSGSGKRTRREQLFDWVEIQRIRRKEKQRKVPIMKESLAAYKHLPRLGPCSGERASVVGDQGAVVLALVNGNKFEAGAREKLGVTDERAVSSLPAS
ncbi:hypothetical protein GGX14DRAFT_394709 [Mycena pura]|uniref:Uncharacterized protein n=1 Tax=Mycena pura TaxID=153505 RepID=A0AAD6VG92_9AGAR|nr:hypothetical protein GGX14DRAFT_394709 [Mycena pura]